MPCDSSTLAKCPSANRPIKPRAAVRSMLDRVEKIIGKSMLDDGRRAAQDEKTHARQQVAPLGDPAQLAPKVHTTDSQQQGAEQNGELTLVEWRPPHRSPQIARPGAP